jgi:hypothetical protein
LGKLPNLDPYILIKITNKGDSWCSRPKHNEDGYLRKGKFKKASNMNFALNVSIKAERLLQQYVNERTGEKGQKVWIDPNIIENDPKISAGGNVRMGEIVLIVDSDTRVVRQQFTPELKLILSSPKIA